MQAELIDRAVENIADGQAVNWDLLDSQANDEEDLKQLKWLRVLEEIANLHRSTVDPLDSAGEASANDDPPPPPARIARPAHWQVGRSAPAAAAPEANGTANATANGGMDAGAGTDGAVADAPAIETWGRYHLLDKVGEGSFGSVYRAWDPQLEREIAIKILHRHVTDDRLRDRLLREGRALAKIRQPNVVSAFGVESHEDRIGLCMEFVEGLTLEDALRTQGTFSARETVLVGEDVCRALAAVHNAGFVHRDVKARNVMREQAGRIVLMDFGTGREARVLEEARRPDVVGTPLYMAPEVLSGETASTRSDVYSVGVLLYHLVTSEYPINARSVDDLRDAHKEQRRRYLSERRPDLPTAFVRVVERALAADPHERYANAGALLNALGGVLGDFQEATRSVRTTALLSVAGVTLIAGLPLALGFINSVALNVILERTGFSNEGLRDWWVWGARSMVAPLFFLMLAWFALTLSMMARNVALGMSSRVARLDAALQRRVSVWTHQLSLDSLPMLSSWIFLLSAGASAVAWWYFWPLMTAAAAGASRAPADLLALLSPEFKGYQTAYRQAFTGIALVTIAAWYGVIKLSRRRFQPLNGPLLTGGAAIIGLALVALDVPYRLLLHTRFDVALWNNARCYVIGERPEDLLLFCPLTGPPRNVTVPKNAEGLQRTGEREQIFTLFAAGAGAAATRSATLDTTPDNPQD